MKISAIPNGGISNVNFKQAQVNILATADNHGNIMSLPQLIKTVEVNKEQIFPDVSKNSKDSTLNLLAFDGDWFINPSKKGSLTEPDLSNGDIQFKFLQKTIGAIKEICGEDKKFDTVYAMGNHCLDGGDKFIINVMNKAPMKSIVTNVDLDKSPALSKVMEHNENIVKSHVYSIPDDKNPDLINKVLFLGVTIPSMDFYNPGLLKGLDFYDNCNKKDANLKKEDLKGTFKSVKEEVDKFKEENPKGAVVLLSHAGEKIAEMIRDESPEIDVILSGHDHVNGSAVINNTVIHSLGKDNEIIKALNLHFDDKGNLDKKKAFVFDTKSAILDETVKSDIQKYIDNTFSLDVVPRVKMVDKKGEISELAYGNEIRFANSYLANFLTKAVKSSVKKICPDVDIVSIQSSIIRGGLKEGSTNLDLMKIFDGVSEDLSNVQIGRVTGRELTGLITENIISNLKSPTRNTIMHWSDIQIDRSLIADIASNKKPGDYYDAIKLRNPETKKFERLNPFSEYNIVLGEKYLVKDDILWPGKIRDRFVSLDKTYDQLFRDYMNRPNVDYTVKVGGKVKEQRVL